MSEHPMAKKARKLFEESLKEKTPIRWLMVNTQTRTIPVAIQTLKKHCAKYPETAEAYHAEEVMEKELICERQAVLSLKTQTAALNFLSLWYNRPRKEIAYRYKSIKEEAQGMDAEALQEEAEIYRTSENRGKYEEAMPPHDTTAADSEEAAGVTGYADLVILNIKKRISELEAKRDALIEERQGRAGKIKELLERRENLGRVISSIETLTEEYKRRS